MQFARNRTSRSKVYDGKPVLLGFLLFVQFAQAAHGGELAFGVGYVGEYSDNIRRSPVNPQSEWTNSAIASAAYRENGPSLDAHLQAQAEYRDYRNDVYLDTPYYYADASLLWKILPQRLNWILVDRYDQTIRDITLSETPDNLVNSNVFTTGPDLFIRLGSVNTLVFGARYGEASYGTGGVDNTRIGLSASWQYAVNRETTSSLNYQGESVEYENEISNYIRNDVFIRVDTRQARTLFLLDLGYTQIDRDLSGEVDGYLARLTWTQQLTFGSSAGVLLGSEFQDAGSTLLATATSPSATTGTTSAPPTSGDVTNDLFYTKRAEVYYDYTGNSYGLNSRIFFRDIDYEIAQRDRQESGGLLGATYNPSSLLAATLYGSYVDTHYRSFSRDDRESEAGIRFLYRANSSLNITLDGRKTWRYSTDPSREFTESRVLLSLLYSTSPLSSPARR